ncbi:hypothetical protein AB0J86_13580 [Micromonospora sp. NPDC049559]|uniref:hypothetical protein n=1 Tax=Micromonospora sp. NPDC049559 TaxID=3155923 RepID=UPI003423671D
MTARIPARTGGPVPASRDGGGTTATGGPDGAAATATGAPDGAATAAADTGTAMADVASISDRGTRIALVLIAFGWHTAIGLPAVVDKWSQLRLPWVVGAGWLLFVVVGLVAAVRLLRGGRVPASLLAGALLLVDAAVFASVPAALLFDSANFGWGTVGWFLLLVLWERRIAWLVAALTVNAVVALVAVLLLADGSAADLSRYAMYVYGTATLPVFLAFAGAALRTLAASTAGTAAARARLEAERIAARRARADRRERLSMVSQTAGAVLAELADGRADPADPRVQRRCALEAARLRRLIAESDDVPDPLLHELRAAIDIAERNGLPVELVAVGTLPALPVHIRRQLAEPLTTALAAARQWARLTVVGQPDEVVVSLVAPAGGAPEADGGDPSPADRGRTAVDGAGTPAADGGAGEVEFGYEQDGELVWAQTRWRVP